MKATLLLCDFASVAEGKLNVLGAGWTVTSGLTSHAVAILLDVPWDRANTPLTLVLELKEQDGAPVVQGGPTGPVPVRIEGQFEVGRPAGTTPGTAIPVPFAFPVSLQLSAGGRYYWEFAVEGRSQGDWVLPFSTAPAVPAASTS